jgi:carboxymethylenebutenolidase
MKTSREIGESTETSPAANLRPLDMGKFSAAAQPLLEQAVSTDDNGIATGQDLVHAGDVDMPVYFARPVGQRTSPILLVVSEVFGVHKHIADVCRRFAKLGYFAVAPQLFIRQGDPSAYSDVPTLIRELVSRVADDQVLSDLDRAVEWAAARNGDRSRLGVTGFCWGGRITWLYASHNQDVKAAVAWYGRLAGPASEANPVHPVDVVGNLHAPTLGLYGGQDGVIPPEAIDRTNAILSRGSSAARASKIVVYPRAGHAFFADYRQSYRADDAQDGWERCVQWLAAHGMATHAEK